MIQMQNTKFKVYATICFWVMLITDAHTHRHTHAHTHTHTDQTQKMWFLNSGDPKTCKPIKISISKVWPQNNTFSTYRKEKVKMLFFGKSGYILNISLGDHRTVNVLSCAAKLTKNILSIALVPTKTTHDDIHLCSLQNF